MKLLVIDGNSIVNRAFFGMHPLTNGEGFPTHAIYGFLNILRRMEEEVDPDGLCVTFDRKEPTFRHLAYEGYKAQRKKMPEDLAVQIPVLKQVLDAMNIPCYELAGWEADDLIGTISRRCEAAGWDCRVATGDKDSLQLITDHTYIELVTTRMGKTTTKEMDPGTFQEVYGFAPPQMVDLKALMGDSSDNIPGVPGVGEKTAMALLHENGTLETIYRRLEDETLNAKPGVKKKLTEGRESAFQSYDLCTIHCDAPMDFTPEETIRKPVNAVLLRELFLQLEFHKLLSQMGLDGVETQQGEQHGQCIACTLEEVKERSRAEDLLSQWKEQTVAVLTLPDLSVLTVCWGDQAVLVTEKDFPDYDWFLRAFFVPEIAKLGYHCKDTMSQALKRGFQAEGFCFDGAIAAYLLSPTDGSYDLDKVGAKYFGESFPSVKDYLGSKAWNSEESRKQAMESMARHGALVQALYQILPGKLETFGLTEVYEKIELPLCPVLAAMEQAGMLVDQQALEAFGQVLKEGITRLQAQVYEQAGEEFNLNSTQQLGHILFEKLGLPPVKKTKTGYSTSAEVLEKLRLSHPIIDSILGYRQLTKLNSTYVEGLAKVIGEDGRIHTSFQNTVTATGRLSSTEPNLQNIPIRTELGAEIRKMFIARPGWTLVDADYSQIELRLLAHMAKDEKMIESFRSGEDIHAHTASQVFGVPVEEVTPELRRRAKAVNFGIVYGISGFSLAQDIGVTRREADEYMERYLATFSGVRTYMYEVKKRAKEDGYVSTLMGRRRWLPELQSSNYNLRSFGERVALNMPIQGTAADVMKLAMIRVFRRLEEEGLQARLILQVHDELIVECPLEEEARVKTLLVEEMEGAGDFLVPLLTDVGSGRSWAEAKD
ncbi:MAG: DNA polymerase I [Evtepia sp.]|uniref:DNA polymerase I n=1 Tax=Evtepia sp. TaxID=2773933 RepID=UPI002A752C21|nr:DNA polymerase I [Evtepia sp.]MDY3013701.1 DNA polymerase I [Evtepia sp.]